MSRLPVRSIFTLATLALSLSAQACGYVSATVEGDAQWFSLDNPFDIALLSLGFGGVCAVVPGFFKRGPD